MGIWKGVTRGQYWERGHHEAGANPSGRGQQADVGPWPEEGQRWGNRTWQGRKREREKRRSIRERRATSRIHGRQPRRRDLRGLLGKLEDNDWWGYRVDTGMLCMCDAW